MQRNPYAAPTAKLGTEASEEPSNWQRAKLLFGGLWVLLTVLPLLNALLEPPTMPNVGVLLFNSFLALGFSAFLARDMWLMKVRRSPLIVDICLYVIIVGGLVFLIVLKESGLYVWNDLHLDVPVFLLMGSLALAAWMTEAKKAVRVYIGARHFIFVHEENGL